MNRRGLLLAGSALALAGCRGKDDDAGAGAPVSETSRRGDIELLGQLIDAKRASLRDYPDRHAPEGFADLERAHLRRLAAAVRERGGPSPDPPPPARPPGTRGAALDRMIDAEHASIALLIDVVPKFGDPRLRALGAQMLAVEAQQLSLLRSEAGSPRLPDAFVYGGRPE